MLKGKYKLKVITNGQVHQCFARVDHNTFEFQEDKNLITKVHINKDHVIVQKKGKVNFISNHKSNSVENVEMIICEGNNKFDLMVEILTKNVTISSNHIKLCFESFEQENHIEYILEERNEF